MKKYSNVGYVHGFRAHSFTVSRIIGSEYLNCTFNQFNKYKKFYFMDLFYDKYLMKISSVNEIY